MKPGDEVWFFYAATQAIMAALAQEVIEYPSGSVWIVTELECGILNRDIFPTREALCEHYRKIFE
jgi:hypothetical protein